jgi:hypothetical protein
MPIQPAQVGVEIIYKRGREFWSPGRTIAFLKQAWKERTGDADPGRELKIDRYALKRWRKGCPWLQGKPLFSENGPDNRTLFNDAGQVRKIAEAMKTPPSYPGLTPWDDLAEELDIEPVSLEWYFERWAEDNGEPDRTPELKQGRTDDGYPALCSYAPASFAEWARARLKSEQETHDGVMHWRGRDFWSPAKAIAFLKQAWAEARETTYRDSRRDLNIDQADLSRWRKKCPWLQQEPLECEVGPDHRTGFISAEQAQQIAKAIKAPPPSYPGLLPLEDLADELDVTEGTVRFAFSEWARKIGDPGRTLKPKASRDKDGFLAARTYVPVTFAEWARRKRAACRGHLALGRIPQRDAKAVRHLRTGAGSGVKTMGRGPGIKRCWCYCQNPACRLPDRLFQATREDATTCSPKCRKARNRLLGGGDGERCREGEDGVTDKPNVFRVLWNDQHVGSFPTRELAELAIAGWMPEWGGGFRVKERRLKM